MQCKFVILSTHDNSGNFDKYPVFHDEAEAIKFRDNQNNTGKEVVRYETIFSPTSISDFVKNFDDLEHVYSYDSHQLPYHIHLIGDKTGKEFVQTITYSESKDYLDCIKKQINTMIYLYDDKTEIHDKTYITAEHWGQLNAIVEHFQSLYGETGKWLDLTRQYMDESNKRHLTIYDHTDLIDYIRVNNSSQSASKNSGNDEHFA